jgi:hypothetical protein
VTFGYNLPSLAAVHEAMPNTPEGYTIPEVLHVHSIALWLHQLGFTKEEMEAEITGQNIAVMEDQAARRKNEISRLEARNLKLQAALSILLSIEQRYDTSSVNA